MDATFCYIQAISHTIFVRKYVLEHDCHAAEQPNLLLELMIRTSEPS